MNGDEEQATNYKTKRALTDLNDQTHFCNIQRIFEQVSWRVVSPNKHTVNKSLTHSIKSNSNQKSQTKKKLANGYLLQNPNSVVNVYMTKPCQKKQQPSLIAVERNLKSPVS